MTLILKNDLESMLLHIDDILHLLCVFRVFLFASLEEANLASKACIFYLFLFNNQLLLTLKYADEK